MKKIAALFLIFSLAFAAAPLGAYAAYNPDYQDSVMDKIGDWFAVLGKSPEESDMIIADRRADRAAKKLGKQFGQEAKKAQNRFKEFSKEMEKAMQ